MIIILTIIYVTGCILLGFVLMNKYDKFLSKIDEKNSNYRNDISEMIMISDTTVDSETRLCYI